MVQMTEFISGAYLQLPTVVRPDSYKLTKTYREWFDGPDDWVHLRGIFTATNCSQAW